MPTHATRVHYTNEHFWSQTTDTEHPIFHPHTQYLIPHLKIIKTTDLTYFCWLACLLSRQHNDPMRQPDNSDFVLIYIQWY